jgi:hypothetical protein
MSSQRQIEANRRNAQKSTGPKTEAGKTASSSNALKHGFTAERFVVEHEDASEFDAFRDDFFAEHAPATATQTFLVEQMVAAAWRIRRIRNAEAAYWNLKMIDSAKDLKSEYTAVEDSDHLAYAIQGDFYPDSAINNLSRYEARLERAFYKALHELERLRRDRRPAPQIGSVSPKPKLLSDNAPDAPDGPTPIDRIATAGALNQAPASASAGNMPRSRSAVTAFGTRSCSSNSVASTCGSAWK